MLNFKPFLQTTSLVLLGSFLLASCSGPTETQITADNINVEGEHKQHIQVVDATYTMKALNANLYIPVKFKLLKSTAIAKAQMGSLSLIPLDASGAPINDLGLNFSPGTMEDWAAVKTLLNGAVGEEQTITFEWSYFRDKERQARILKEIKSFKITRATITTRTSSAVPPVATTTSKKATPKAKKGGKKWDTLLDDYEDYVQEYVAYYKKAIKGDQAALAAYPALLQKANKLQSSMAAAQSNNELSAAQIGRMMKIQAKMLEAL